MANKASDQYKVYCNENGPVISTVSRAVIEKDGLYFKDIDGTGKLTAVNDWRMGPKYPSAYFPDHVIVPDESGLLDEAPLDAKNIFGEQIQPGTTEMLKDWFARFTILREAAKPGDLADYLNQLQYVAENCEHFVPVAVASNSRNEMGEVVFGMNDGGGVFASWPGTLGVAAAVRGAGIEVADKWAEATRRSWEACGLR